MIVSRIRRLSEQFTGKDGRTYRIGLYVCKDVPKGSTEAITLYEVEIDLRCVTQNVFKPYKHKYFTNAEPASKFYATESMLLKFGIKVSSTDSFVETVRNL